MANTSNTTTAVATVATSIPTIVWAPAVDGSLIVANSMEELRRKIADYNQDYYSNR